jgi:hypothetical protein
LSEGTVALKKKQRAFTNANAGDHRNAQMKTIPPFRLRAGDVIRMAGYGVFTP